jgi:hypothetical protein
MKPDAAFNWFAENLAGHAGLPDGKLKVLISEAHKALSKKVEFSDDTKPISLRAKSDLADTLEGIKRSVREIGIDPDKVTEVPPPVRIPWEQAKVFLLKNADQIRAAAAGATGIAASVAAAHDNAADARPPQTDAPVVRSGGTGKTGS